MESWMPFFVGITALAVVVQALVLAAIYFSIRNMSRRIEETTLEIRSRVAPMLGRVQSLIEEVHPQISNMVADAAHITHLARTQVQHADRVVGEAIDRVRIQLVHTDQILTGALETIEETGLHIRRTVLGPVQSITSIIRGIQTGLEFFRGNRRRADAPASTAAEPQDETLFI